MSDEIQKPMTDKIGGTKFILIILSFIILAGMFFVSWSLKILDKSLTIGFLWCLGVTIITGVGSRVVENLIPTINILLPLLPDIVSKSFLSKKDIK